MRNVLNSRFATTQKEATNTHKYTQYQCFIGSRVLLLLARLVFYVLYKMCSITFKCHSATFVVGVNLIISLGL